jgi:hypothetical protein
MMDHNYASNIKCTAREQRTDFAPPSTFCFDGAEVSWFFLAIQFVLNPADYLSNQTQK